MKFDTSKYEKLEEAKAERERLLALHAEQIAAVDAKIAREHLVLGLSPYVPPDGSPKGKSRMSEVKKSQHERIRQIAREKGYVFPPGHRKAGKLDVDRVRRELKAKELGISPAELLRRETEARALSLQAKLKAIKVKR